MTLEISGKRHTKVPNGELTKHLTRMERVIHYFRRAITISHQVQESLSKAHKGTESGEDYTRGLEEKLLQIENENISITRDLDQMIAVAKDQ